ncbi:DUF2474 domain-containing protein [Cupriavidus plantarum]|uniref:DUF2474 domain-containing protein n=1 Tax=Cupriavidus plantarum TaxID=942865 RepID=UPI000F10B641|nr:DUF2474 domain-containing protein [Cupriavidus plantarum]RLK45551.1 uncharacterized protein DUF2474 [Cupriavidus plantarum]
MNERNFDPRLNRDPENPSATGAEGSLGLRLGWMALLWLGGVGTVFVFATIMRLLMRLGGLVS